MGRKWMLPWQGLLIVLDVRVGNAKCKMQNLKCEVQNAKWPGKPLAITLSHFALHTPHLSIPYFTIPTPDRSL